MNHFCKKTLCFLLALLLFAGSSVGKSVLFPSAAAYEAPLRIPRLSGNITQDIFTVAKSQTGYTEDVFGGTVYGEWWTEVTDIGYDCTRADWCAIFVCWCMDKVGAAYGLAYNKLCGSVDYLFALCRVNGSVIYKADSGYVPKSGDLAFYSYDGGETLGHVSITDGDNRYVHANYASAVVMREGNTVYRLLDKQYYTPLYYVSPNYEATYLNASSKIRDAVLFLTAAVLFTPGELEKMLREKGNEPGDPPPPVVKPPVDEFIRGDVDRDGSVTAADARLALRAAVGLETLSPAQMERGDLNGDGDISAEEARVILRAAVGLESLV